MGNERSYRVSDPVDKVAECSKAIMQAIKGYDTIQRIVALEMVLANAIVSGTTYTTAQHRQAALDSFGHELDGFMEVRARRMAS